MSRVLPSLTVFAAVLLSGAASGLLAQRWAPAPPLEAAAQRLAQVPWTLDDWDGHSPATDVPKVPEVAGLIERRYVNRKTGDVVTLLLLCGRPGPISVHTPDICYRNSGYDEVGGPVQTAVPGADESRFRVRRFDKRGSAAPVRLRIYYAWSVAGVWAAPENPRLSFARVPVLHKLYLIREMPRADEGAEDDPTRDFLRTLVPQLRPVLFPLSPG